MKQTLKMALAMLLTLSLAGCGGGSSGSNGGGSGSAVDMSSAQSTAALANPMHKHNDKAALAQAVGFAPLDISPEAGYTVQAYYDIDGTLAQIMLTDEAGDSLTLRARKDAASDISGVWGVEFTEKTLTVGGTELAGNIGSLKEEGKETFVAWFTANGMAYSVSASGPELTMEHFEALLPQLAWGS